MKWIVIVSVACSGYNNLIYTNNGLQGSITTTDGLGGTAPSLPSFSHTPTTSDINKINLNTTTTYTIPAPLPPSMEVYYFDSKEDAEEKALNYISSFGCSHSSLVISPKGEVFKVSYVEKTKTVMKPTIEVIGHEPKWEKVD